MEEQQSLPEHKDEDIKIDKNFLGDILKDKRKSITLLCCLSMIFIALCIQVVYNMNHPETTIMTWKSPYTGETCNETYINGKLVTDICELHIQSDRIKGIRDPIINTPIDFNQTGFGQK